MVNFNIIENDYSLQDKYEVFKDYYLHPEQITLAEIMTRLNLSHSQARTLRQQVSRETGLKRDTGSRKLIPVTMKCNVHPKKYLEKYPEFKELYLTRLDYTKKGIKKELELTEHEYNSLRKKCNVETGLKRNRYFNQLIKMEEK